MELKKRLRISVWAGNEGFKEAHRRYTRGQLGKTDEIDVTKADNAVIYPVVGDSTYVFWINSIKVPRHIVKRSRNVVQPCLACREI